MKTAEALKNVFVGTLMGIFMMLPGASGATMAVVFRVYERLIRDISKIRTYLIKDIGFIATLGIGGVIGLLICAKGLDFLIESYEIPIMFFFGALISVQLPDIAVNIRNEDKKLTKYNILALVCGFLVMMAVLILGMSQPEDADYGMVGMFVAGILYALCALSPGISGSTMLLALGLLTPVLNSLTEFELMDILPLILGALFGIICFAKAMDYFVNNCRRSTYCAIFGLTLGSVVTVVVQGLMDMDSDEYLVQCIIAIVIGLIVGYGIHVFSSHYSPEDA